MSHLCSMDEDVSIYMFAFLRPPQIISMRKTCRRLYTISKLRIVWTNACARYILQKGYPFSIQPLESMPVSELEQRTCHAYHLASRWLSGISAPRHTLFIDATSSTSVSDVRFVPGYSGERILTVSKGIWDVFTIWDISSEACKACEWSQRGAIFNGIALNTDPSSEATLAIAVLQNDGKHAVQLISMQVDAGGDSFLKTLRTISSSMKPIKLHGDLLAISDDVSKTVVSNWRTGASAILQHHPDDESGVWQLNRSIQVVFAHHSILVVRATSIHLFPEPELRTAPHTYEPLAYHSFGWIDGVSVTATRSGTPPTLSILLRGESDDPWSSGLHSLDFYTLQPNLNHTSTDGDEPPSTPPYIFPPTFVTKVPAVRGSLRCRNVVLGPCGTAVWIQPQDRAVVGLAWAGDEEYPLQAIHPEGGHESLVVAAFPGPFAPPRPGGGDGERLTPSSVICTNSLNNWMALDYDEEMGRVALCSSFGRVLVLEL